MLVALLLLHGCSPATQSSGSAASNTTPSAPAASATIAAPLNLCRPADLPPADLRAKPGYTQMRVIVTDAQGNPVSGLKQSDLSMRTGEKTYPITFFRAENPPETPVSIVVVADVSATMYDKMIVKHGDLTRARAAIIEAGQDLNDCDEMAMVVVGGTNLKPDGLTLGPITYAQPFTTEKELPLSAAFFMAPSGKPLLADGIRMGLNAVADGHYTNRALVVMTDGLDSKAVADSVKVLESVPKGSFSFWVIGIGDPDTVNANSRLDAAAIKTLAVAGGGEAIFVKPVDSDNGASLSQAIKTIGTGAARGYTVGAVVPAGAETPAVVVKNRPSAIVSAARVSNELLTAVAALPPPVSAAQCINAPQVPSAISSQPGFSLLAVSVTDRNNTPVTGLKQSDFTASCGGSPCPIVYFEPAPSTTPLSLALVVDTSGSMRLKLQSVEREFARLIESLRPCDEVALFAFSNRTYLLQPSTIDHRRAAGRLALLQAGGPTALYDAIEHGLQLLAKVKEGRKALVVVTDGVDNKSGTPKDKLLADLRKAGVPVYVIGIGPAPSGASTAYLGPLASDPEVLDPGTLSEIARAGGGRDFVVPSMVEDQGEAFSATISSIMTDLTRSYTIGVDTSPSAPIAVVSLLNRSDSADISVLGNRAGN